MQRSPQTHGYEELKVQIPEGAFPGRTVQIKTFSGKTVSIVVPPNSSPGEVVTIRVETSSTSDNAVFEIPSITPRSDEMKSNDQKDTLTYNVTIPRGYSPGDTMQVQVTGIENPITVLIPPTGIHGNMHPNLSFSFHF